MKKYCALVLMFILPLLLEAVEVIRINQVGYLPGGIKIAVYLNDQPSNLTKFQVIDQLSGKCVFEGLPTAADAVIWGMKSAFRLNFSLLKVNGRYQIKAGNSQSQSFTISEKIYDGTADFILSYMRQQRCGFNPFLKDSCHTNDGMIVDNPSKNGTVIDVKGGWHDASDYLQYATTTANAVYQLLFAYQHHPSVYKDHFLSTGLPGENGIPDILDEARWGLEWLLKMNPAKNEFYNQVADDRDHRGFRLPNKDTLTYGLGKYRPVYFVTGKSQGLGKYKNRTTGVSSIAAKYASSFSLGASIFNRYDQKFADKMKSKAMEAWDFSLSDLGVCQTACIASPYFYEEENYVDDLELAAATLSKTNDLPELLKKAGKWGEIEPVTPWMELHRARHYQFYPFVNLGHVLLAKSSDTLLAKTFTGYMKQGLDLLKKYAVNDPFPIGIPFIWCSNNLVTAAATQALLYRQITGDQQYIDLETALTDWLFGCNPWGTTMICGLPKDGDSPQDPHSAITKYMKQTTFGGLVDGPVYTSIFKSLLGITLLHEDTYAQFQNGKAVYHDDSGDYSTNEPTMDGTASLSYLLSHLEMQKSKASEIKYLKDKEGAVVRIDTTVREVYLIFSAHEFGEGGETIVRKMSEGNAKGSFFFTGDFYKNGANKQLIKTLISEGHYVAAHSDAHLLYADWTKRDSLLVDRNQFEKDIKDNYAKMLTFGIKRGDAKFFLPPFEWYNRENVKWAEEMGLVTVNFTPGIRTNADYTTPDMTNYRSSDTILSDLKSFEKSHPNGLKGAMILIHLGTSPKRTDKLYNRLDEILQFLKEKGYGIKKLSSGN